MKNVCITLLFMLAFVAHAQFPSVGTQQQNPSNYEKPVVVGGQTAHNVHTPNTNTQMSVVVDTVDGPTTILNNSFAIHNPVYNKVTRGFFWKERPWAKAIFEGTWNEEMQRRYPQIEYTVIMEDYFGRFAKGEAAPGNINSIRRSAGTKICRNKITGELFDAECGNKYDEFVPWVMYVEKIKYVTRTETIYEPQIIEVPGETKIVEKEVPVYIEVEKEKTWWQEHGDAVIAGFTGFAFGGGVGYFIGNNNNTPTVADVTGNTNTVLVPGSNTGGNNSNGGYVPGSNTGGNNSNGGYVPGSNTGGKIVKFFPKVKVQPVKKVQTTQVVTQQLTLWNR